MSRPRPASPRRGVSRDTAGDASRQPGRAAPLGHPERPGASSAQPDGHLAGPPGTRPARLPVANETSAGGLVCRSVDGVVEGALIGRIDHSGALRWLLPKGHLEDGESPTQAAVREVAEETGISGHVVAAMGTVDYWFTAVDRRVHKTVHHYLLLADSGELSTADVEVDEVAWLPLAEVLERLSYEDERRLASLVPGLLASGA